MGLTDAIDMMALLEQLGPLPRTLACRATDRAYEIIATAVPGAVVEGYPCGSAAWSWTIPQRWELNRAIVRAPDGRVLLDSNDHHLHCVNYSQPFKGRVSRDELLAHLHTYPDRPSAIPFIFYFYDQKWGLCLPHERLSALTDAEYDVEIDCAFEDGELSVLSALLPGDYSDEFLICANVCHPTQANDSLTGLVAGVDIFKRLSQRPSRKYSYRLLIVPETIGSIAYMSRHPEVMQRTVGGFFSEMLGTAGDPVLQASRRGDTYWDVLAEEAMKASGLSYRHVPFMKSASNDEKCLDAPGVGIPMVSLTRYPYPEYHSDDDNVELIDVGRLRECRDALQAMIDLAEADYVPVLRQPGPIFLSGHGLRPDVHNDPSAAGMMASFYDVMYALDGDLSICQTARKIGRSAREVRYWADAFASKGLLEKRPFRQGRSACG
jgi:aminopeptidase-like protein